MRICHTRFLATGHIRVLVLPLLFVASTAQGKELPVSDFDVVGYDVRMGGKTIRDAEVFLSKSSGSFLILSPGVPAPVLIKLRAKTVETLHLQKVNCLDRGGNVQVLPGATLAVQTPFTITKDQAALQFEIEGIQGSLQKWPLLLGRQ